MGAHRNIANNWWQKWSLDVWSFWELWERQEVKYPFCPRVWGKISGETHLLTRSKVEVHGLYPFTPHKKEVRKLASDEPGHQTSAPSPNSPQQHS